MKHESFPEQFIPISRTELHDSIDREREAIHQSLQTFLCTIPTKFWKKYLEYQKNKHYKFLIHINSIALLAYLFFGVADYFVLPDIGLLSLKIRLISVVFFGAVLYLVFRYCKRIEWLDLYLPYCTIVATVIWFALLSQSQNPNALTFQYASVIFIVLANLGVQVRFLPSVLPSIIIAFVTCAGVYIVSGHNSNDLFIFSFAYFPIAMFSLYISWNSTYKNRQFFLNAMLDESNRQALDKMAHTDELTSLHNRRYFEVLAEQLLNRSKTQHFPVFLLLLDIDHFKKINDGYGHDVGDDVLKFIGEITKQNIRQSDLLARFGGEEFIILLPNTDLKQAEMIADRICYDISQNPFHVDEMTQLKVTSSIGFARYLPHCHSLRSLIKCADLALYVAKQQGRNRVVMHHNPT